jgi:hypothetical protein
MQINKATWAEYFRREYGWTWDQVVLDVDIHLQAAREIFDITEDWTQWSCSPAG